MYSRRAALVTSISLKRGVKLCRRNPSDFRCFVEIPNFVRNFGTATKQADGYTDFDDFLSDYVYNNRTDLFDSIDKKPNKAHKKIGMLNLSKTFGSCEDQSGDNFERFDSRDAARNIVRDEVNPIPNRVRGQNFGKPLGSSTFKQNMSSNGISDTTQQNRGGVCLENSKGGLYDEEEDVFKKFDDALSDYVFGDFGRDFSGIDQNPNPNKGNGKTGTGMLNLSKTFGFDSRENGPGNNSAKFDSRIHAQNIVRGEVNSVANQLHGPNSGENLGSGSFQQNVSSIGFGGGGISNTTPQNRGGVCLENSKGGLYGEEEDVFKKFDDALSDYVFGDYGRDFSGIHLNPNPNKGNGKTGTGMLNLSKTFGFDSRENGPGNNSARFDRRVHAQNIVRGEVNSVPNQLHGHNSGEKLGSVTFQQNVSSNGFGGGGISNTTPQNRGGVCLENSKGGLYGEEEDVFKKFDDALSDYVFGDYGRDFSGIDLNPNPNKGNGKTGTGMLNLSETFGFDSRENGPGNNSARFDRRVHAQNIVRGEVNSVPNQLHGHNSGEKLGSGTFQQNVSSNGFGGWGISATSQPGRDSRQNQPGYNSVCLDSRVHAQNIVRGEMNSIPNRLHGHNSGSQLRSGSLEQNVNSNGFGGGGISITTPQNRGRVCLENSKGGLYGVEEDVFKKFDDALSDYVFGDNVRDFNGIDLNPNPNKGNGKTGTGMLNLSKTFGFDSRENRSGNNSARFDSRVHAQNIVRGEVNSVPNQLHGHNSGEKLGSNVNSNGFGGGGISGTFQPGRDSRQNQSGYNSVWLDSRVHAQNIVRGEVNSIPNRLHGHNSGRQLRTGSFQQNVSSNGFGGGGISSTTPQNRGGVCLENSKGGLYDEEEDVFKKFDDARSDYVFGDYGRDFSGIDLNPNPNKGNGKTGTGMLNLSKTFGFDSRENGPGNNSARFDRRVHAQNIVRGEVNSIPNRLHGHNSGRQLGSGTFQQNVSSNGFGGGGISYTTPQNRGGVCLENSKGGLYDEEADVFKKFDDALSDYVFGDYGRDFSGIDLNPNPNKGNGKTGTGMLNLSKTFGFDSRENGPGNNSARFDRRVHAQNIVRGEVNSVPNQLHGHDSGEKLGSGTFQPNVSSIGYGGGGISNTTPQNRGGVFLENSKGGLHGKEENVFKKFDDALSDYVFGDYGRDFSGIDQNPNPNKGNGKTRTGMLNLSKTFGFDSRENGPGNNSARFDSRVHAQNIVRGEVNRIPNQLQGQDFCEELESGTFLNVDCASGEVNQIPNQLQGFCGELESGTFQNVDCSNFFPQNVAGSYYSNAGAYPRSLSEYVGTYSPVMADVALNDVGSGEVAQESQSPGLLDHLDQFTREGKMKEAMKLLGLLEEECVQVELPRYMALVKACGENEVLAEAKSVHEHLVKSRVHLMVWAYNEIIEMYSKCGSMKDAFAVFDQMPERNLMSWDIMVSWLAKNGHAEESLELFSEFKQSGLRPDGQMFHGVFSACGIVSDIIEGMLQFESMMNDYDIVPAMDHYVSIVDMLGNAGCLDEALEFIQKMPIEPSIEIWETLMKFCRIHGNTVLGDQCAELVQLLDPLRLHEQSREGLIPLDASDLEKEKEKLKLSGKGPLDVRQKVNEYRAGDRSHPDNDRLYGLLKGLTEQMKDAGYVPEVKCVLHDVDEESKEEALMAHSERLAVAHGLLTSTARAPVYLEVPSGENLAKSLHSKGIPYVIYWKDSFSCYAASQFP